MRDRGIKFDLVTKEVNSSPNTRQNPQACVRGYFKTLDFLFNVVQITASNIDSSVLVFLRRRNIMRATSRAKAYWIFT